MTLEELHDHLFDVLCVIDDICKKENVRYFLDSGTEIGAVRDGDFIPWDDDADIKVLAEDYPAFKAAMEKHLPSYLHLVEPADYAPAFFDPVVKIYDKRLVLRESTEEDQYYKGLTNHVCVDVFLFTKVPDSMWAKTSLLLFSKILYGMGMGHRYALDFSKYKGFQRAQVAVLSAIGKLFPAKHICLWSWKNAHRYMGHTSAFRFCSNYRLQTLQFFPEDNYHDVTYFPIRNRLFPVPAGYHQELTQQYGDYMTPIKDTARYIQHLV